MNKNELQEILRKHKLWLHAVNNGEKADLRYADLRYADLRRADLRGANLSGANLNGTNLDEACLKQAILNWVSTQDIVGQKIISVQVDTTRPNNQISYWVDLDIWVTGCFQGSLEDLKERIDRAHRNNKFLKDRYYRAINFILNEAEQDKLRDEEQ